MYRVDEIDEKIRFYYTKEQLFNNVSLRSTYKARSLMDQEGNYVGEPYALSDDEKDAFEVCVGNIVSDLYDTVLKLTSGVPDAFVATADEVVFIIRDNHCYNINVLQNVDISIKNALICGILREWYDVCAKPDYYEEYAVKYRNAVNLLRDRIFQLKKKAIS